MDQQQFDRMTTTFAQTRSRRGVVTLLGAATASALSIGILATPDWAGARRKKKGKGKGKERCLKSGKSCETDGQCCRNDGLICDVPHGASNSDTACCGGEGAVCGGVDDEGNALAPFCCVGSAGVREFVCSQNDETNPNVPGTCIPALEE